MRCYRSRSADPRHESYHVGTLPATLHTADMQGVNQLRTLRVCQPTAANAATVSGGKETLAYVMSTMSGREDAMKAALVF